VGLRTHVLDREDSSDLHEITDTSTFRKRLKSVLFDLTGSMHDDLVLEVIMPQMC